MPETASRILEKMMNLASSLFGSHWKSENSEAENLRAISEWILKFRKALYEGRITEKC